LKKIFWVGQGILSIVTELHICICSSLCFWAKITFLHFLGLWPSFLWKIVNINQAKTTTQVMAVGITRESRNKDIGLVQLQSLNLLNYVPI
jgi:ABC-type glycerol-3-phosphate transport system permease component